MRSVIILALVVSVLFIGCAKKEVSPAEDSVQEEIVREDTAADAEITGDVSSGIDDIDRLEQELDDSELDSVEKDLADLEW